MAALEDTDRLQSAVDSSTGTDWEYKAEGGANVAFKYIGSSPGLRNHILRVRKLRKSHTGANEDTRDATVVLSEQLLHHGPLEYAWAVMQPAIGSRHVVPGQRVTVSKQQLAMFESLLVEAAATGLRPAKRQHDALDTSPGSAVMMMDHSVLHTASVDSCVDLCIELKPKAGLPPPPLKSGEAVAACRFCMHQALKALESVRPDVAADESDIASLSDADVTAAAALLSHYCPLRLYSENASECRDAILAMMAAPQNNFRLFVGGRLAFGAETLEHCKGEGEGVGVAPADALEMVLNGLTSFSSTRGGGASSCDALASIVSSILRHDGILGTLKRVQAEGEGSEGAQGAWRDYKRVTDSIYPPAADDDQNKCADEPPADDGAVRPSAAEVKRYASFAPQVEAVLAKAIAAAGDNDDKAFAEQAARLRAYMIGATAKDCLLMIALRLRPQQQQHQSSSEQDANCDSIAAAEGDATTRSVSILLPNSPASLQVTYRVSVVDLDPKPLARIPHYARLESLLRRTQRAFGEALFSRAGKACGIR